MEIHENACEQKVAHLQSRLQLIEDIDTIRDQTNCVYEMMPRALEAVERCVPTEFSAVVLINEKTGRPEVTATRAASDREFPDTLVLRLAARALKSRDDVILRKRENLANGFVMPIIFSDDQVFGALVLINKPGGFDTEDRALLHAAEDQLDSALEHVRLFNDLARKNKELNLIYIIDHIRDTHKDMDSMLSAVLHELVCATDAAAGFIILHDDEGRERASKTLGQVTQAQRRLFSRISRDALHCAEMICRDRAGAGVSSILCIPLILDHRIIGTFGVANPRAKAHFDSDEERLLAAVACQADTAIFEDLTKQRIKGVFKRYVNDNVVEQMLKVKKSDKFITGQRLHMSVLFADMRGFTAMSEGLKLPEDLVVVINEYLAAMTDVVMGHDGTLDKFVGDEVMALFGAPVHYPAHARVAIETAIEMQQAMHRLHRRWKRLGRAANPIGIGINTGPMVAGNIGCEKMTSYTVLGDSVNLGARLCSAAKGWQILVSRNTFNEAKSDFCFNPLDPILVKGKKNPVPVYEVIY